MYKGSFWWGPSGSMLTWGRVWPGQKHSSEHSEAKGPECLRNSFISKAVSMTTNSNDHPPPPLWWWNTQDRITSYFLRVGVGCNLTSHEIQKGPFATSCFPQHWSQDGGSWDWGSLGNLWTQGSQYTPFQEAENITRFTRHPQDYRCAKLLLGRESSKIQLSWNPHLHAEVGFSCNAPSFKSFMCL